MDLYFIHLFIIFIPHVIVWRKKETNTLLHVLYTSKRSFVLIKGDHHAILKILSPWFSWPRCISIWNILQFAMVYVISHDEWPFNLWKETNNNNPLCQKCKNHTLYLSSSKTSCRKIRHVEKKGWCITIGYHNHIKQTTLLWEHVPIITSWVCSTRICCISCNARVTC